MINLPVINTKYTFNNIERKLFDPESVPGTKLYLYTASNRRTVSPPLVSLNF